MARQKPNSDQAKDQIIKNAAHKLAREKNIDAKRVRAVFERMADIHWSPYISPDITLLHEAMDSLEPDRALKIFENDNLDQLRENIENTKTMKENEDRLLNLGELSSVTYVFKSYLEALRDSIIETGYMESRFEKSPWLDDRLGKINYVDEQIEKRKELFNIKLNVLNELFIATNSRNATKLFEACLYQMKDGLTEYLINYHKAIPNKPNMSPPSIERAADHLMLPGYSFWAQLILTIRDYESELTLNTFQNTKEALGNIVISNSQRCPHLIFKNYFQAIANGYRKKLDSSLEVFTSTNQDYDNFRRIFFNRFKTFLVAECIDKTVNKQIVKYIYHDFVSRISDQPQKSTEIQVKFKPNNDDYSSITVNGIPYGLTHPRAKVIKCMHEFHKRGDPDQRAKDILNKAAVSQSRLVDVFGKTHPLWGTLIINTNWGIYRLNIPD